MEEGIQLDLKIQQKTHAALYGNIEFPVLSKYFESLIQQKKKVGRRTHLNCNWYVKSSSTKDNVQPGVYELCDPENNQIPIATLSERGVIPSENRPKRYSQQSGNSTKTNAISEATFQVPSGIPKFESLD